MEKNCRYGGRALVGTDTKSRAVPSVGEPYNPHPQSRVRSGEDIVSKRPPRKRCRTSQKNRGCRTPPGSSAHDLGKGALKAFPDPKVPPTPRGWLKPGTPLGVFRALWELPSSGIGPSGQHPWGEKYIPQESQPTGAAWSKAAQLIPPQCPRGNTEGKGGQL